MALAGGYAPLEKGQSECASKEIKAGMEQNNSGMLPSTGPRWARVRLRSHQVLRCSGHPAVTKQDLHTAARSPSRELAGTTIARRMGRNAAVLIASLVFAALRVSGGAQSAVNQGCLVHVQPAS